MGLAAGTFGALAITGLAKALDDITDVEGAGSVTPCLDLRNFFRRFIWLDSGLLYSMRSAQRERRQERSSRLDKHGSLSCVSSKSTVRASLLSASSFSLSSANAATAFLFLSAFDDSNGRRFDFYLPHLQERFLDSSRQIQIFSFFFGQR